MFMIIMLINLLMLSTLIFINFNKFILLNLISIEFIMIISCNLMFQILKILNMNYYIIFFLVFFIIEGIFSLSLLIIMINYHGNDNIKMLNMI